MVKTQNRALSKQWPLACHLPEQIMDNKSNKTNLNPNYL
jgi:hypothetical protein